MTKTKFSESGFAAADYNPRMISPDDMEKLSTSLDDLGNINCILFNKASGRLVSGHFRKEVFEQGMKGKDGKIVLQEEFKEPTEKGTLAYGYIEYKGERHAYRVVDWEEGKEKRANVAANSLGGEWDTIKLGELFDPEKLEELGMNMVANLLKSSADILMDFEGEEEDLLDSEIDNNNLPKDAFSDREEMHPYKMDFNSDEDRTAALAYLNKVRAKEKYDTLTEALVGIVNTYYSKVLGEK